MKSLYESIISSNNASIENELIEWCKSKFIFDDLPIHCEKYKDGYNIIIDSFEHQPQIAGITLKETPPKHLRGIYYMKYDSYRLYQQGEGVKMPLTLRFVNTKLDKLDLSKYHFEQPQENLSLKNFLQLFDCKVGEITGLPTSNGKPAFYKMSLSNIDSMHDCVCPNIILELADGNSLDPFNIYNCEFKKLLIGDLILGRGMAQMLLDKTLGSSTFDGEEYVRQGNIYVLNEYYQKIVEHILTKNKIGDLQVWVNPSKSNRNNLYFYHIIKNPKYGYCLKK